MADSTVLREHESLGQLARWAAFTDGFCAGQQLTLEVDFVIRSETSPCQD
jgi:hypothetical protein